MFSLQANMKLLIIAALCALHLHMVYTMPTPQGSSATNSSISVVVTQALAGLSIQQTGNINTAAVANSIAGGLAGAGIGPCHNCKKRDESYILDQYYRHCNYSGSNLTRVPLPDLHLSSPPAHVLTGNTEYVQNGGLRYDSQCFSRNAAPKCTWSQSIKDLGEDVFPRFAVNVTCSGCKPTDHSCNCYASQVVIETRVLKRQNQCDSSGFDSWEPVRETLVVGCGCYTQS